MNARKLSFLSLILTVLGAVTWMTALAMPAAYLISSAYPVVASIV